MTMPRMELVAATLSVKISVLLKKELQIPIKKEMFWTDSEVVLAYIRNEAKRFKIFVANRIELIKHHSDNVNGFTLAQNRTLQIMLQGALTHAIKTKLKNGFLVQSFFGIQKKSGT